jgi:polysaccharide biosynthesis protein PslJ
VAGPATIELRRQRADGATLAAIYVVLLMVIPARLVLKGVPMALAPSMLIGFALGACWLCAQLVTSTGVAKGRNAVRTALLLFGASQLATYGYATYGYLPPDELNAADRSLLTILAVVAVGITVCDGVTRLERLERLLKVVTAGCAFMATIGILQFFHLDLTPYLALPGLRPAVDGTDFVLERAIFARPAGTAGHPIEFGVVCALAAPLALHFALRGRNGDQVAWVWWACLGVLLSATMMSLSRSGILGLTMAFLLLLPTWPARRQLLMLGGGVLFLGAMNVLVRGLIGTLIGLFENVTGDSSIQARTEDYAVAYAEIAQHPWFGRGYGTYLPDKYGPLDNQYLGTLVQNGYLGLAALIGILLAGMYAVTRARLMTRDPVRRDLAQTLLAALAVIAVSCAFFDTLAFGTITGLLFVLVGASGALLRISYRLRAEYPDSAVRPGAGLAARILSRLRRSPS